MFFSEIYGSWKEIQKEKYRHIFRILGEDFLDKLENKRALDVGCGNAYLEEFFTETGVKSKITGMDLEFTKYHKPFVLGDANEMPFKDEIFDIIFCIDTIHLVQTIDFARVLKKKGLVLAAVFFNEGNYYERKEMMREKLSDLEILLEFEINGREKECVVLARKK